MNIATVGTALPRHRYEQSAIQEFLHQVWGDRPEVVSRVDRLCARLEVEQRCLAMPLADYVVPRTFGQLNDIWIEAAVDLGEQAILDALARAGTNLDDVGALFTTSVTGIASPSIDARLMNRVPLPTGVARLPMFGLGCVGGAACLSRATDYVRAHPTKAAIVLSVELCSLNFQPGDHSVAHLIAAGLFADGAAAAIVYGAELPRRGPEVLATRSVFYRETEDLMGWQISEHGFRIVLSPAVPTLAREQLGADVDAFLADTDLTRSDIDSYVCHPGGPKVLRAVGDALQLDEHDLALSWDSLRQIGNLSSASVLFVLRDTMDRRKPDPGTLGLIVAMGPGFCSELLLVRW